MGYTCQQCDSELEDPHVPCPKCGKPNPVGLMNYKGEEEEKIDAS